MVEFTSNYGLYKPDFNISGWHENVNGNFDSIDALLFAVVGLGNFVGQWTNSTNYTAQQRVFDPDDGSIWNNTTTHTSAATGTMASDRALNPTYWSSVSSIPIVRGAWANDTVYAAGDIVYDTTESLFTIASVTHTSSSAPDTLRDDLANWDVIADLSVAGVTVSSVNTQIGAVVLDSDDISDVGKTHKFATAAELAAIGTFTSSINALDARLDVAEPEIDALQAADVSLDSRLDTAETEINSAQADITTLNNSFADTVKVLAKGTLSNTATLDINLNHSGYKAFKLHIRNMVPVTDNVVPLLRFSNIGTGAYSAGASDYAWVYVQDQLATTNNSFDIGDGADTEMEMSSEVGNAAGEFCEFEITIVNPAQNSLKKSVTWTGFMVDSSGLNFAVRGTGLYQTANPGVDEIRFMFASGNISSGSYSLVGIK